MLAQTLFCFSATVHFAQLTPESGYFLIETQDNGTEYIGEIEESNDYVARNDLGLDHRGMYPTNKKEEGADYIQTEKDPLDHRDKYLKSKKTGGTDYSETKDWRVLKKKGEIH